MSSVAMTRLATGLLCLSQIGMVHAADKSSASEFRSIDIRVQAGGFGVASASDITSVLQSAAGELCRYWPRTQLPRIDVYHRPDHPQTDSRRAAGNRIAIGLTGNYAPWFSAYAEERLALSKHHLPAGTPFVVWFRANEPALRKDFTRRDRNIIVAAQLLPIFEKEPRGWRALAFFSRPANPNQSLSQHFTKWRSDCPREFQRFLAKLAAVFEVEAKRLPAGDGPKSLSNLRASRASPDDKLPWNEFWPVNESVPELRTGAANSGFENKPQAFIVSTP